MVCGGTSYEATLLRTLLDLLRRLEMLVPSDSDKAPRKHTAGAHRMYAIYARPPLVHMPLRWGVVRIVAAAADPLAVVLPFSEDIADCIHIRRCCE